VKELKRPGSRCASFETAAAPLPQDDDPLSEVYVMVRSA
jgi:hypothetical protein